MPLVRIDVRKARTQAEIQSICEAVHGALEDAFRIRAEDRRMVYTDHTPDRLLGPPGRSDLYTLVEVLLFTGRSLDAKRAFYRAVVANLGGLGIPASEIFIVLNEQPLENWGVRGGQAACDVDLGFEVRV